MATFCHRLHVLCRSSWCLCVLGPTGRPRAVFRSDRQVSRCRSHLWRGDGPLWCARDSCWWPLVRPLGLYSSKRLLHLHSSKFHWFLLCHNGLHSGQVIRIVHDSLRHRPVVHFPFAGPDYWHRDVDSPSRPSSSQRQPSDDCDPSPGRRALTPTCWPLAVTPSKLASDDGHAQLTAHRIRYPLPHHCKLDYPIS